MTKEIEETDVAKQLIEQEANSILVYSGYLLRNFKANFLDDFLSSIWDDPKEYHRIKKKYFEVNSFNTISKILEHKIKNEKFNDTVLENKLFEELAWTLPDLHFIYKFETKKTIEQVVNIINAKTACLNKPIHTQLQNETELKLVSLRIQYNKAVLLFRKGYTDNEEDKKTIFFISCELDFSKSTLIIKMRETLRKHSKIPKREIINEVLNYINKTCSDIDIRMKSAPAIKRQIYEIFTTETKAAESILISHIPVKISILDYKIKDFVLNGLNLNESHANQETIKSLYFKNIAQSAPTYIFKDRYIFAFTFNDGTTTRSITRDHKRNHIYGKDLYWSLRSIVHNECKVEEISMYYKINSQDYKNPPIGRNFLPLEVTIKEFHGSFMIDYYNNYKNFRDQERRYKSEFIIYELEKYL